MNWEASAASEATTMMKKRLKFRLVLCGGITAAAVLVAVSASAQKPEPPIIGPPASAGFRTTADTFDWDGEGPNIHRSIDNVFKANDWTDESDRYAQYMVRDVVSIPPWQLAKRIERMTEHVANRYGLTEKQRGELQGKLMMEFGAFIGRNADTLFAQAREALNQRAQQKPYDAEQIAKWMKAYKPMRKDVDATMDRLLKEIGALVGPEAKEVFDRDVKSFHKRDKHVTEMMDRWAEGKWKPSDWGMQDDPIQTGKLPPLPDPKVEVEVGPPPPKWLDHDPSTWFAYVLDFKARFKLDVGQATTAKSIHTELLERATTYISGRLEVMKAIPISERGKHEAYAPVRTLFAELRARLDAIPTTGQRPVPRR